MKNIATIIFQTLQIMSKVSPFSNLRYYQSVQYRRKRDEELLLLTMSMRNRIRSGYQGQHRAGYVGPNAFVIALHLPKQTLESVWRQYPNIFLIGTFPKDRIQSTQVIFSVPYKNSKKVKIKQGQQNHPKSRYIDGPTSSTTRFLNQRQMKNCFIISRG